MCNLFAAEVRTYSFLSGYIDVLDNQSSDYAPKIRKVLQQILKDECRHVGYTGRYINRWMSEGLDLSMSLRDSFKAYDRNSWVEIAATAQFFFERP